MIIGPYVLEIRKRLKLCFQINKIFIIPLKINRCVLSVLSFEVQIRFTVIKVDVNFDH